MTESPRDLPAAGPRPLLGTLDAIGVITGIVIGAGIFTLPAHVAAQVGGSAELYALWFLGGVLSLLGALCYAELSTTYPDAGGDYFFLRRAWGDALAFLFAWARATVIVTGSLAFLAFTYGDYMSLLLPLGAHASSWHAASAVVFLTALNTAGLRTGKTAQNLFTTLEVLGLVAVIVTGLLVLAPAGVTVTAPPPNESPGTYGLALLFVLFAYGGWNEAAYLSAETRSPRVLVRALMVSLSSVMALYVLVNVACVRGLGFSTVAGTNTVVADLLARAFGTTGSIVMSVMVAVAMLTSMNATIIVGARSNFAVGRDFPVLGWLGRWHAATGTPLHGLVAQCLITLALIGVGTVTREGLRAMIDYTAPVFWFFFLLVALGMLRLRKRDPGRARPFTVPWYPLPPIAFAATCAWLLVSSIAYVRTGAIAGVGVLVLGLAPLAVARGRPALATLLGVVAGTIIALAFPQVRALLWR